MISDDSTVDLSFRTVEAIARTTAALVRSYDVIGVIGQMLAAESRALDADAAGVTMRRPGSRVLELLAATSHRAEELELYQAQQLQGPCYDAVEFGVRVTCTDLAEIRARWPQAAPAFERAGIGCVHATPLRWHGHVIGALNLFWVSEPPASIRLDSAASAFADLATLAIVHSGSITGEEVVDRTRSALDSRTVIEQAKGVLAASQGMTMETAYLALVDMAEDEGMPLSAVATSIVENAVKQ
ncbi:ANTAR domain-containing protein [Nakamurella panacisegetis]|uniref:ANTAR domain-containing protein n=1 Tax=Nakamurella panacisegetis TaxID=1090615 RepID=A0A1H0LYK3_9ACTN|nr:GAF and ANTAR domain-containing protein [Nakamurella panacisegetis]SDO73056.1 ANTAR domain-containing protein [Nakamurella panacisegetis]